MAEIIETFTHSDALRWVNVVLSSMVVALMVAGAWARWQDMPLRFKRITPWVVCTYVIIAYGSGEVLFSDADVPLGLRVSFLMLDLLGLVIALVWRIDDADYSARRPSRS